MRNAQREILEYHTMRERVFILLLTRYRKKNKVENVSEITVKKPSALFKDRKLRTGFLRTLSLKDAASEA